MNPEIRLLCINYVEKDFRKRLTQNQLEENIKWLNSLDDAELLDAVTIIAYNQGMDEMKKQYQNPALHIN